MRQVVPDVYVLEGLSGVNVYLLTSSEGLTLVDTGPRFFSGRVFAQLQEAGFPLSELRHIVITHWHGDHAGNLAELARHSGAQVVAHRDEVASIEQTEAPPASTRQRMLNWLTDHVLFARTPCKVDLPVQDGDVIDALGGLQVIHTPGHTLGSICLYQPERQILFCGDTVFSVHPLTGRRGLGLHMRFLALDYAQVRDSARKLSALPIEVLCCGHGEPVLDGAGEKLAALVGSAQPAA